MHLLSHFFLPLRQDYINMISIKEADKARVAKKACVLFILNYLLRNDKNLSRFAVFAYTHT